MTFYFGEKEGDALMRGINLRNLSRGANQWDHPVKGLLKCSEEIEKHGGDIFKISKKDRECYCVSLISLALKEGSGIDWWMHMPKQDPPDGMVMILQEERRHEKTMYMGYMREVEVVEHRDEPNKIFETIRDKMVKKAYEANTILVCLILTPAIYDLKRLSELLGTVKSTMKHVFVVFAGAGMSETLSNPEGLKEMSATVQLLPTYEQATVNLRSQIVDFKQRYEKGQESRLIEGGSVYYGTTNPRYGK
jgi:hypothetical protein